MAAIRIKRQETVACVNSTSGAFAGKSHPDILRKWLLSLTPGGWKSSNHIACIFVLDKDVSWYVSKLLNIVTLRNLMYLAIINRAYRPNTFSLH